jgi:hypothetical protein
VAESAYGAAAAVSSLPSSDDSAGGVQSLAGGENGSGGAAGAAGPADTQQAAYDRMQQLLAAANPGAQPLQDPAERSADCLTPSPGKLPLVPCPGSHGQCRSRRGSEGV